MLEQYPNMGLGVQLRGKAGFDPSVEEKEGKSVDPPLFTNRGRGV